MFGPWRRGWLRRLCGWQMLAWLSTLGHREYAYAASWRAGLLVARTCWQTWRRYVVCKTMLEAQLSSSCPSDAEDDCVWSREWPDALANQKHGVAYHTEKDRTRHVKQGSHDRDNFACPFYMKVEDNIMKSGKYVFVVNGTEKALRMVHRARLNTSSAAGRRNVACHWCQSSFSQLPERSVSPCCRFAA